MARADAQRDSGPPAPPHDYSLVVPAGPDRAPLGLARLRDGVLAALRESKQLADGFPQPGIVVRTPSATDAHMAVVSCGVLDDPGGARQSTCIRLGADSYVQFGTVDFPDSRAYLFEVFLFDRAPDKMLDREAGLSMTRITVHHPIIMRSDVTARPGRGGLDALAALQRGLLLAGARPLRWKEPR